jgi:hypothetical protein
MPCTPYAFRTLSFDNDTHTFLIVSILDGITQLLTHSFAETIEMPSILHLDIADAFLDNGIY